MVDDIKTITKIEGINVVPNNMTSWSEPIYPAKLRLEVVDAWCYSIHHLKYKLEAATKKTLIDPEDQTIEKHPAHEKINKMLSTKPEPKNSSKPTTTIDLWEKLNSLSISQLYSSHFHSASEF